MGKRTSVSTHHLPQPYFGMEILDLAVSSTGQHWPAPGPTVGQVLDTGLIPRPEWKSGF